jgi:hypothetical protein
MIDDTKLRREARLAARRVAASSCRGYAAPAMNPESPDSPGSKAKTAKLKGRKADAAAASLSDRVERSLKDVDRLLKKNPDAPPEERVMAQLEQAKVAALLQVAEAIRETRRADGPPRA